MDKKRQLIERANEILRRMGKFKLAQDISEIENPKTPAVRRNWPQMSFGHRAKILQSLGYTNRQIDQAMVLIARQLRTVKSRDRHDIAVIDAAAWECAREARVKNGLSDIEALLKYSYWVDDTEVANVSHTNKP